MINIKSIDKKMLWLDGVLIVLVLLVALSFLSGPKRNAVQEEFPVLTGDYLGQKPPGTRAEIFAPGILSTALYERDTTISPDGKEFYFSVLVGNRGFIVVSKQEDGRWSKPEIASFSGKYSDLEPALSPDGKKLFFTSRRPLSGEGVPKDDYDIWVVDRVGDDWGEPRNPGPPLNSTENEFYPSVTKDYSVYFTAALPVSIGGEDIFLSRFVDGKYSPPENPGSAINTEGGEFNAYIAPDESFIIYTTTGREKGLGASDLWINFRQPDGAWSKAVIMGEKVNSPALDYSPSVSPDGKYLFFTSERGKISSFSQNSPGYDFLLNMSQGCSNGNGDLYWVSTEIFEQLKNQ